MLWIVVSAAFAVYVANFGSYNKTYGALGGVIVFMVWLWLTNLGDPARRRVQRRAGARALHGGRPPRRRGALPPRQVARREGRSPGLGGGVSSLRGGDEVEHGGLVAGAQQRDRVGLAVDDASKNALRSW